MGIAVLTGDQTIRMQAFGRCLPLLLATIAFAFATDEDVERRLSNRDCPMRNKTIKTGIVLPSECVQLQGKWVRSWQSCGSICTRTRACKAWTYKGGRCNLYRNGKKTCGFVTSGGVGTIAGYSGCQV